ncbi:MAG: SDR family oxidoreductase [Bryobacterales bacterium]
MRVNSDLPGLLPAEQNRKILDKDRVEKIFAQTPMARFGEPEELIGAVILLCSRKAGSFITGAEIYARRRVHGDAVLNCEFASSPDIPRQIATFGLA